LEALKETLKISNIFLYGSRSYGGGHLVIWKGSLNFLTISYMVLSSMVVAIFFSDKKVLSFLTISYIALSSMVVAILFSDKEV
jgi:hypothetical protein